MTYRLLFALLAISLTACSSTLKRTPSTNTAATLNSEQALRIQYLGVGGHIISVGERHVIAAPSFTNPHFLLSGPFMPLSSDHDKVDRYMPKVPNAEMLLVGHAHYDHLLDVPRVATQQAPNVRIYGSQTTVNTLSAALDPDRLVAMNTIMASGSTPGQWLYNQQRDVRIMAIESGHAPHIAGIKFMSGTVPKPLSDLPWHSFGWKEGQTLAFLIDFLDASGNIQHRVYYQDAASQAPLGLLPQLADNKRVDVAILCPASFSQVEDYPEAIVRDTGARHFILGHWEDFFANDLEGEQRFVRLTDEDEFIQRLEQSMPDDSRWVLPALFTTYTFEPTS
ncbi:hypothetical protein CHH28_14180 [Bacterioplanes sanyensis]|uniref:Uncharacterized protein n=1 Tax=Bacterioplanes sanyensis TaxID=1249553 RepID=A0A222FLW0_9GAMM|nr:MBL fold metallo-hydrolase [Bacterioplanes sanyensis]ASP39749.1 hypothetical protein CHH28_14180 [Bacterioplanes sanyensis]